MDGISSNYEELILKAREGDREALEALCRNIERMLLGFFGNRYNDQTLVNDLSQEAYLRFLNAFPRLKEPQKFSFFVAKIAMHVHYENLENKYKNAEHSTADMELTVSDDRTIGGNGRAGQYDAEIGGRIDLERALATLPGRTRKVLKMKMDGQRYSEIARHFDISSSAVKMIVNRGIKKLKNYFSE